MKNILTVGIGCLITSFSFAGTMGANDVPWIQNGFYLAGDIGVAGLVAKESHTLSPETHQLGALGIVGGGYVGYEYAISHVLGMGLEFFADATGLNASITHVPDTYKRHQSYDLGIRLLPEYAFTSMTAGHVFLGYTNARFSISDDGVYGYVNKGFNQSGFQTGLGFTTHLKDNLSLRLDAIYNIFASQTSEGQGLPVGTKQLYRNTFSNLTGEISVIYKIG